MKNVIEMAREAGIDWNDHLDDDKTNRLDHFAELVRADEREACAKVFEGKVGQADLRDIAAAIRARSNT